jgi:hypothetical protein
MIQANYTTIAAQLQEIRDPRSRRGQSYEWQYLLIIVASAVLAGEQSVRAIAQWAAEQAQALQRCIGYADCRVGASHERLHDTSGPG